MLHIEEMSPAELNTQYACYKESIGRLKRQWNKLSFEARARAGHTLLNLRQQMERIEILQMEA